MTERMKYLYNKIAAREFADGSPIGMGLALLALAIYEAAQINKDVLDAAKKIKDL
jgi:hypothetical protein